MFLTLCLRLFLASSLSFSHSLSRVEEEGSELSDLSVSFRLASAALWASLDIRANVRTGVRGNPAATQGVDRNDDDDDDKLPAGKEHSGV